MIHKQMGYTWTAPKVMPPSFFSLETVKDAINTIILLDRANSQLEKIFFNIDITISHALSVLVNSALVKVTYCFTAAMMLLLLGKYCPHSPLITSLSRWKSKDTKS